jgi:hypothetical protein
VEQKKIRPKRIGNGYFSNTRYGKDAMSYYDILHFIGKEM